MPFAIPVDIFLKPVHVAAICGDEGFRPTQLGSVIAYYEELFPDLTDIDLVIVGCGEQRGDNSHAVQGHTAPDAIRRQLYALHCWHSDIKIADVGNIVNGATITDTYAALRSVVQELKNIGKTVLIIGGSHDCTLAQFQAYAQDKNIIEATGVD